MNGDNPMKSDRYNHILKTKVKKRNLDTTENPRNKKKILKTGWQMAQDTCLASTRR
jgi:hypothetical protein